MMIGIAVLAIPLAIGVELKSRSDRYRRLAAEHALRADHPELDPDLRDTSIYRKVRVYPTGDPDNWLLVELYPPSVFEREAMREHPEAHRALAAKYAYAASHPWVTVPPQEYWAWSPTDGMLVVREMR
jgi:hypothetical protein